MLRLRKALLLSPGQLLLPDQDAEDSSTLLKSWVLSKGTRRTESWEMVDGTLGVWRLAFSLLFLLLLLLLFLLLCAVVGTWPCKNQNKTTKSPERAGTFSDSARICEVDVLCQIGRF